MAKKKFQPNDRTKLFIRLYEQLSNEGRFKSGADLLRKMDLNETTYKATLSQALKPSINIPDNFFIQFCNYFKLDTEGNQIKERGEQTEFLALQEKYNSVIEEVKVIRSDVGLLKDFVSMLRQEVQTLRQQLS